MSRLPEKLRPAHIRQINGYIELLRSNDLPVDSAFITYMTFSRHLQVPVEIWGRQRTQEMLSYMTEFLRDCMENREVPPREECAGPDRWYICKFCSFRDLCKEHPGWWAIPANMTDWRG